MLFRQLSKRDILMAISGACFMHFYSSFSPIPPCDSSILVSTHIEKYRDSLSPELDPLPPPPEPVFQISSQPTHCEGHGTPGTVTATSTATTTTTTTAVLEPLPSVADLHPIPTKSTTIAFDPLKTLPETSIVAHAPGWTIFRNLYMSGGTLFILSSNQSTLFPEIRLMTSTSLPADSTPENMALREPTSRDMNFLTPGEAHRLWRGEGGHNVLSVEGNTWLFNDPSQFLRHYYHFVGELLIGTWAFWSGAFSTPSSSLTPPRPTPPPIHRAIFAHATGDGWRDGPGFNAYVLRAAFPALTVEVQQDWEDRIAATRALNHAWHFPLVLLTDRSAAHRGVVCGSQTQRTAAEAWEAMRRSGRLFDVGKGGWWEPVRRAVLRFAGVGRESGVKGVADANGDGPGYGPESEATSATLEVATGVGRGGGGGREVHGALGVADSNEDGSTSATQVATSVGSGGGRGVPGAPGAADANMDGPGSEAALAMPEKVVITYISRQSVYHRKLPAEDHNGLVEALADLVARKGSSWELNVLEAEKMTKDEQVRVIGRTTILLGVHGNGLTHLVLMPATRVSTVIEIFCPGGFAHDYHWTARALGMSHFAVWNDTYYTYPNEPKVDYPEGFQGNEIPVYGPTVANIIEGRVDGRI